jgi:tRNA threonylcarbamoyladenosine biosynthesis protein TsaB
VVRAAGLTPAALRAVVAGGGPGSFTGLRIAAATAKGMVRALEIPLFAYSGLLAAAAARRDGGRPVCAMFDARNREVYAGCWRFTADGPEELMSLRAGGLDEIVAGLGDPRPLFTGEGAWLHAAELGEDVAAQHGPSLAAGLLWLARVAPELGFVPRPALWEPEYVRASGAERIAAEGRTK